MNNYKRTLLIDLDGVLNQYEGIFDKNNIPPIKKGAAEFIRKVVNDFELKLFTTRNRLLASKWLMENNLDEYFSDITNVKDTAWLIIDDRCVKFQGDYDNLYNEIRILKFGINNGVKFWLIGIHPTPTLPIQGGSVKFFLLAYYNNKRRLGSLPGWTLPREEVTKCHV